MSHPLPNSTPSNSQPFNIESLFKNSTPFQQDQNNSISQNNNDSKNQDIQDPSPSTKRGKTGCITCRLRKKRCDEAKPICATCSRLGIECMGYGVKRPKWLRENDNAKKAKQNIKQIVLSKRSSRGTRQGSSADSDKAVSDRPNKRKASTIKLDSDQIQEQSLGIQVMDIDTGTTEQGLKIVTDNQSQLQHNSTPHFWELGPSSASATSTNTTFSTNNDNTLTWNISPTNTNMTTSTMSNSTIINPSINVDTNSAPQHMENTFQPQPSSSTSHNFMNQTISATSNLYTNNLYFTDPSIFPPQPSLSTDNGLSGTGEIIPGISSINDMSMDALWGLLFGPIPPPEFILDNNGSHINPNDNNNISNNTDQNNISNIIHDTPLYTLPTQSHLTANLGMGLSPLSTTSSSSTSPNLSYLHHYLNVVLPLQFRIMKISISMGDFVAPLALKRNEVLTSVSSLAALHMVAQRTQKRFSKNLSPKFNRLTLLEGDGDEFMANSSTNKRYGRGSRMKSSNIRNINNENDYEHGEGVLQDENEDNDDSDDNDDDDENDTDVKVAMISHQKTMERLRFITPKDLTTEEIIVPVLFGVSYHIFCGGTSKHLKELLSILQRCLSAALYSSPELGSSSKSKKQTGPSPWARYRLLIEHMIWTDIIASVTNNKASPLLPMYRKLLDHSPSDNPASSTRPFLLMDRLMGSDSTTLLAMCETVALSEWKDRAEAAGCLSYKELLDKAANIERILNERSWRESHLERPTMDDTATNEETEGAEMRRIMTDVFHSSVKVLLAVTINGPFPRVPEIASAVGETMEALNRLDIQTSNVQIHRALVLPITIAGCHCETLEQQEFFRQCFECLGPEARAFGNTGPALELMEEVWKRRNKGGGVALKVNWIQTMYDLGWENGILLI